MFGGGSIKKCNICNVCEIESWIYHIYRGGDPQEESGGIIGLRCPIESKRGMMCVCVGARVIDRVPSNLCVPTSKI